MHIVKHGNHKEETSRYLYRCGCGCVFVAEYPSDFSEFGVGEGFCYGVYCPECNTIHLKGLLPKLRYQLSK